MSNCQGNRIDCGERASSGASEFFCATHFFGFWVDGCGSPYSVVYAYVLYLVSRCRLRAEIRNRGWMSYSMGLIRLEPQTKSRRMIFSFELVCGLTMFPSSPSQTSDAFRHIVAAGSAEIPSTRRLSMAPARRSYNSVHQFSQQRGHYPDEYGYTFFVAVL